MELINALCKFVVSLEVGLTSSDCFHGAALGTCNAGQTRGEKWCGIGIITWSRESVRTALLLFDTMKPQYKTAISYSKP